MTPGADLVMSAGIGLPAITGDPTLPATLTREVMHDLVRDELRFTGLTITDALDMAALPRAPRRSSGWIAAIRGPAWTSCCAPPIRSSWHGSRTRSSRPPAAGWEAGGAVGVGGAACRAAAAGGGWCPEPTHRWMWSAAHLALAREVAERSIALVHGSSKTGSSRSHGHAERGCCAVMPRPRALTPADTSDSVPPGLAAALRERLRGRRRDQ